MSERDDLKLEIAATAARLIAEDGSDYGSAKQKAARHVLGDGTDTRGLLPDNALVEFELRAYLRTFCADTHPVILRALRELAATTMQRLAPFRPHLVGALLNGTATAHSDIHLHLFADSAKDVEMFLLDQGVEFEALEADAADGALETIQFVIQPARARGMPRRVGIVLTVHEHDAIRVAPRFRSRDPNLHSVEASGRADLGQLQTLLADTQETPAAPAAGS